MIDVGMGIEQIPGGIDGSFSRENQGLFEHPLVPKRLLYEVKENNSQSCLAGLGQVLPSQLNLECSNGLW